MSGNDPRDVDAAVREAYTIEGQAIWWRTWATADSVKRRRMERGVLVEWSGNQ